MDAVNELERLTTNLSQKIWQKINIVERHREPHAPAAQARAAAEAPAAAARAAASSSTRLL